MTENNFPAAFRKLRKTLDMQHQDVAELFDESITTVSNYESGTTRIPVERIEKLRSIALRTSDCVSVYLHMCTRFCQRKQN